MTFTIHGEPASKANSRKIVTRNGRPAVIKSEKALDYVTAARYQLNTFRLQPLSDDVFVEMTIYYASRRPDLDESVILDILQGYCYHNDRQVKKKIITWGLDKLNPRAEITVTLLPKEKMEIDN